MTLAELKSNTDYTLHHTASARGYVSRKVDAVIEDYNGKFGTGYRVLTPRWDTTRYVYVTYYVKKNIMEG